MWSCQTISAMLVHKSSKLKLPLLRRLCPHRSSPHGFHCVLDQIAPSFSISSSLGSVVKGSGSVLLALANLVKTSSFTFKPTSLLHPHQVRKAIAFAKTAHHGQMRKTGDPYLTHCIHTGRILAMLVPSTGRRAVNTIVAGILHDDTSETLQSIESEFGDDVAKLVAGVSRLSYINQLLSRHRRVNVSQGNFGQEEANNLRVMLLGMVDDPRVVLIKLADRLHNMRTIYPLPFPKAQAVAHETLVI